MEYWLVPKQMLNFIVEHYTDGHPRFVRGHGVGCFQSIKSSIGIGITVLESMLVQTFKLVSTQLELL